MSDPRAQFSLVVQLKEAQDEIARLRAAAAALQGAEGWRTMESAPKDGTEILVVNDRGRFIVSWSGSRPPDDCLPNWWVVYSGKGWRDLRGSEPAYWRPVPPPPVK